MRILVSFLPIVLFVALFFGSGVYFSIIGVENAFYQLPPTAAIIPALVLAWLLNRGTTQEKMTHFLDGARHPDIITMCIIFILAGALSTVTTAIGSVESTVNLALTIIPENILLVGIFLISAAISTAIGSSMGTIAALAVIVTELAGNGAFPLELGAATLVGGAIFGDNMSVISDTTIASISTQEADLKEKLKLNIKIALVASAFTIAILLSGDSPDLGVEDRPYSLLLVSPYILLISLASIGINVFIVLILALFYSGIVGMCCGDYNMLLLAQDISRGFSSMNEIMLLSICIGGLSGLSNQNTEKIVDELIKLLPKNAGRRSGELVISAIVSVFDLLLANNTIAIIFSGEITCQIARKFAIKPHQSAVLIDIFSCVFQGIIPYGAQVLLVSAVAKISPLEVIGSVYYCYILGAVTLLYILLRPTKIETASE